MRTWFLVLCMLAVSSFCQGQTASQETKADAATSPGQYNASAVWRPDAAFLKAAHAACDNAKQPPSFAECFIDQMPKAGAPAAAVAFTRDLYRATGQVGMMGEFKAFPPVGMAWVVYPLRANDNDGILLLNGTPQFVDPDDIQKLDKTALEKDPLFLQWKTTAPKLDVWPGDRSGGGAQVQYARVWPGTKPGDQRFLFSYPLIDGCHACARSGFANFWWDFDAAGRFTGTQLLSVTRGVPPLRRRGMRPATAPNAPAPTAPESKPASPQSPSEQH